MRQMFRYLEGFVVASEVVRVAIPVDVRMRFGVAPTRDVAGFPRPAVHFTGMGLVKGRLI